MKHIKGFNESEEPVNYDHTWNDAFNKVEEGLRKNPIHYKDSHNLKGEVYLQELCEDSGIPFEDVLDTLVDLVAFLIDEGGYKIVKK